MTIKYITLLLMTVLLSACLAVPTVEPTATIPPPAVLVSADNSYNPQPGDANLPQATVELSSINLIERVEMTPIRVEVDFIGSLPTTCNQLRMEVGLPNDQYQINITLYSVFVADPKCEQVVQQFESNVLLGVYSAGRYTVLVNGGAVGDFVVY